MKSSFLSGIEWAHVNFFKILCLIFGRKKKRLSSVCVSIDHDTWTTSDSRDLSSTKEISLSPILGFWREKIWKLGENLKTELRNEFGEEFVYRLLFAGVSFFKRIIFTIWKSSSTINHSLHESTMKNCKIFEQNCLS